MLTSTHISLIRPTAIIFNTAWSSVSSFYRCQSLWTCHESYYHDSSLTHSGMKWRRNVRISIL